MFKYYNDKIDTYLQKIVNFSCLYKDFLTFHKIFHLKAGLNSFIILFKKKHNTSYLVCTNFIDTNTNRK